MQMLKILLYGRTDPEIRYATTEVLDHIGIPFKEVDNLETLTHKSETSYVLILPETSEMATTDIKIMQESTWSVITVGHIPKESFDNIGCRSVAVKGSDPPKISGLLKSNGMPKVPFFYSFPTLEFKGNRTCRELAKIECEREMHPGIILEEQNNKSLAVICPQIFRSTTYLLSGGEATLPPSKILKKGSTVDKYNRINVKSTETYKMGFFQTPLVNVYEMLLLQTLVEISNARNIALAHKWFFPANRNMAVCLTHDVDHVLSAEALPDALASLRSRRVEYGVANAILGLIAVLSRAFLRLRLSEHKNSLRLLPPLLKSKLISHNAILNISKYIEIESRFNAKSSFYFLNNSSDSDSDYNFQDTYVEEVMSFVKRNECEIGLHAPFDSYVDAKKMKKEKMLLERVTGEKIDGVRQHFLRIAFPDTWRSQNDAGFAYDTTLGEATAVGFKSGFCLPFRVWDFREKERLPLLEIPLMIMDRTLFQKRYMALSPEKAFEICNRLVDTVNQNHGALTLLWHPLTIALDPKRNVPWFDVYERTLKYSSRYNPWYVIGKELAKWWILRNSVSISEIASSGPELRCCIDSPEPSNDFSMNVHLPGDIGDVTVLVNNKRLRNEQIRHQGTLLFSFEISKGRTEVRVIPNNPSTHVS